MSKTHKKVCPVINYIEQLLISASAITGCVSISLVGIPIGIVSSAEGLTIYGITPGIKKFKSIIKKKKKHNKIVLFATN